MRHAPIPAATDRVAASVVDSALAVHRALGPGLVESAYEDALVIQLRSRGHDLVRQARVNGRYDGVPIDSMFRLDIVVDGCVVVELKAVERLLGIHTAQLLTYLRLSRHRLRLLVNFNTVLLRDGIHRVAL